MPRQARQQSNTGYLHVIVRGNGKQILFEEEADYAKYLRLLKKYSTDAGVSVCAYCLLDNHAHMLLKDTENEVSGMMKKIGVAYAQYFNAKYERTGHLFQGRFMSEAIEDDSYFLTAFRYILRNPEKAGICPAKDYLWSSYQAYGDRNSFLETDLLEKMIGSREKYEAWIAVVNDDQCLEFEPMLKDDAWAQKIIQKHLKGKSGTVLQTYNKTLRNEILRKLKAEGMTVRQIERLTGINRGVIQKA